MTINFAHRGYRAMYPENTLLAFRKAIEAGCDGIELDIQLSKDGELVVTHDEDLWRTTGYDGAVRDMTLAGLRALDAGGGERIPLLSEYFELITGMPGMDHPPITNIELKNSEVSYDGMEEKALALVRERGVENRVVFSSFNHESVIKLKKLAPEIPCGFLCSGKPDIDALAALMRDTGVDFLHPDIASIDSQFIEAAARRGIRLNIWTVNDEPTMRRLIEQGAHGIFTDDPGLLTRALREIGGR